MGVRKDAFVLVSTPLPNTEFFLTSMVGNEQLGRPFKYELDLFTESEDVDPLKLLGNPITAKVELTDGGTRFFNGLVSEISCLGRNSEYTQYSVILRPWVWFLTHSSDNKVFQKQTAVDIIKKVFKDSGFSDFKDKLTGSYPEREYCVQYGESTFDFISRLMEDEGIYYYFKHVDGKHEMVLADSPSAHDLISPDVPFRPTAEAGREEEHVSLWAWSRKVKTEKFTLGSYNFTNPKGPLKSEATSRSPDKGKYGQSDKEQYEYGQLYPKSEQGKALATVRIEEQQSDYAAARAKSNVRALVSGFKFKLIEHKDEGQNAEYLIVDAEYNIQNNALATAAGGGKANFACNFTAIGTKTHFRSARITPKSVVRGPQTAVVVGPADQEISTDEYGRVKVQFYWDRLGKKDQDSSCFVRVSQTFAGGTWGAFALPRHGQEVIVDFLEGDPDQPIITGSLYNKDNMVPFVLPTNQTQSGLRTRSTPKGNPQTFNELRFEDKKDSEEIYLHAERDFKRLVENNDTLVVGNKSKDAKDGKHAYSGVGDQTITIYNNRTATLEEGDDTLLVDKGSQKIDVKKKIEIIAGDELKITVGQAKLTMKKDGTITFSGKDLTSKATGAFKVKAMSGVAVDSKTDVKVKAMTEVKIEAMTEVKIKGTMGFEAKGLKVSISGDLNTELKAGVMLDLSGGAMAKLKGGMTMIG